MNIFGRHVDLLVARLRGLLGWSSDYTSVTSPFRPVPMATTSKKGDINFITYLLTVSDRHCILEHAQKGIVHRVTKLTSVKSRIELLGYEEKGAILRGLEIAPISSKLIQVTSNSEI